MMISSSHSGSLPNFSIVFDGNKKKTQLRTEGYRFYSVSSIFDFILSNQDIWRQSAAMDAFLYTYRLFTTAEIVLQTMDIKFWSLCITEESTVKEKINKINLLRLFLSRWTQLPHSHDFDGIDGKPSLERLLFLVAKWYLLLRGNTSSQKNKEWISPYTMQSLSQMDQLWTRAMFISVDTEELTHLVRKLHQLGEHAEGLQRTIKMKKWNGFSLTDLSSSSASSGSIRQMHQGSQASTEKSGSGRVKLKHLKPGKIAEELTVEDQRLFLNLRLPECLYYVRRQQSPSAKATIAHFNRVVSAVQHSILCPQSFCGSALDTYLMENMKAHPINDRGLATLVWTKQGVQKRDLSPEPNKLVQPESDNRRAQAIALWIDVAVHLDRLNNFSSLLAVLTALQTNAIHRLRPSWLVLERLYSHQIRKFETLLGTMSHENNYQHLRKRMNNHIDMLKSLKHARCKKLTQRSQSPLTPEALQQFEIGSDAPLSAPSTGAMIPYLGLWFQDLTFLNHALPDSTTYTQDISTRSNLVNGLTKTPITNVTDAFPKTPQTTADPVLSDSSKSMLPLSLTITFSNGRSVAYFDNQPPKQSVSLKQDAKASPVKPPYVATNTSSQEPRKLINFEKHMREAELLNDLNLLQQSAALYTLTSDTRYREWLDSFPILPEDVASKLSMDIFAEQPQENCSGSGRRFRSGTSAPPDRTPHSEFGGGGTAGICTHHSRRPSLFDFRHDQTLPLEKVDSNDSQPARLLPRIVTTSASPDRPTASPEPYHETINGDSPDLKLLAVPAYHPVRSGSPRKRSVHRCHSARDSRRMEVRISFADSTLDSSPGFSFLRQVANLGSTPNLAAPDKPNSRTVVEYASESDKVCDVIARALTKCGLPTARPVDYELVHIRSSLPDRTLPADANAIASLTGKLMNKEFTVPPNSFEPVHCLCVHRRFASSTPQRSTVSDVRRKIRNRVPVSGLRRNHSSRSFVTYISNRLGGSMSNMRSVDS